MTIDKIPTPAGGKNGRGKACSITELLNCMERVLGVSKKAVLDEEFATFVDLDLSLHIGPEDLLPHFHRCIGEEEDEGEDFSTDSQKSALQCKYTRALTSEFFFLSASCWRWTRRLPRT